MSRQSTLGFLCMASTCGLGFFAYTLLVPSESGALKPALQGDSPAPTLSHDLRHPASPVASRRAEECSAAAEVAMSKQPMQSTPSSRLQAADLTRRSEDMALQLREGNASLGEVIDLASLFLEEVDADSAERLEDGWTQYPIRIPDELGEASLRVRSGKNPDDRDYEVVFHSKESMHDEIDTEFTEGSVLRIRLEYEDGDSPNHCSALSMVNTVPSADFYASYDHLMNQDWMTIGGSLTADSGSCQWTPVRMRLFEQEDWTPVTRKEVGDSADYLDRLDDHHAALVALKPSLP